MSDESIGQNWGDFNMSQIFKNFIILSAVVALTACSSSKKKHSEVGDEGMDGTSDEVATTDPVPGDEDVASVEDLARGESPEAPSSFDAPVGNGQFEDYTVQKGDTLMKIAFDYYGDIYQWRRVYQWNKGKISNINSVPAGTVLKMEQRGSPLALDKSGSSFLIKQGDTLGTISGEVYGTQKKWKRLWEKNRQLIKDPNKIYAGFYLYYVLTPKDIEEKQKYDLNPAPLASRPKAPRGPASVKNVDKLPPLEPMVAPKK